MRPTDIETLLTHPRLILKATLKKKLHTPNYNNFHVDSTTLAVLLLVIITPLMIVVMFLFRFLARRKRTPIVVSIFEESSVRTSAALFSSQAQYKDESTIQQMINRIREIERKIEIVKRQNISEEAKNITIQELEKEKRILEEEIKKFLHL